MQRQPLIAGRLEDKSDWLGDLKTVRGIFVRLCKFKWIMNFITMLDGKNNRIFYFIGNRSYEFNESRGKIEFGTDIESNLAGHNRGIQHLNL